MKVNSKIVQAVSIGAGLLLFANPVFAADRTTRTATSTAVDSGNFCTRIDALGSRLKSKQTETETNLKQKRSNADRDLTTRKSDRAKALQDLRTQADAERAAMYEQLEAKATTDAQKKAVADFKAAMETAVSTRRTAVDAAIAAYWSGVDAAIKARKDAVTSAGSDLKKAVQAALDTAKSECASGADPNTVKQKFITALKSAKTQLTTDRKSIDKAGPQIKALAQTRNDAVRKAFEDFKKTMEKARVALKAAFGEPKTSSSN